MTPDALAATRLNPSARRQLLHVYRRGQRLSALVYLVQQRLHRVLRLDDHPQPTFHRVGVNSFPGI